MPCKNILEGSVVPAITSPLSRPRPVLALVAMALLAAPALADATTEAVADTVHVVAQALVTGCDRQPVHADDTLRDQLARSPFSLIRRGAGAGSDLYVDGFKRGDITVTIDGERFTTACPNRMDTRAGHVNLLDMQRIDLDRTGGGLQAGLGGNVTFHRRRPGLEPRVQGVMRATLGHVESHDLGISAEADSMRTSLRYRRTQPYTDADDRNFNRLYGYAIAPSSLIYEAQFMKAWDRGDAVFSMESATDVLFPYLKMDERENQHYQASVSQDGHRFYINHNEHVMDNALRTSAAMTEMRTEATNTMIGVTSRRFEFYVRNWDADNRITPRANPAMATGNHMLPDVWRLYASLHRQFDATGWLNVAMRLGLSRTTTGDDQQFMRHATLQPGAESDRWSVPFGLTARTSTSLSPSLDWTWSAELSSDAPGIEELYISVDKPGTNPTWLGNPELSNPVRASLRTELQHQHLRCEIFGSRIWNVSQLVRRQVDAQMYQTYENVDAVMMGANLRASWTHLDAGLAWNWAADTGDWDPLAEIQPLTTRIAVHSPAMGPAVASLSWEHAIAQDRVDTSVDESATPAWDRVDLTASAVLGAWNLGLGVENLLNENYARHLSYQRNPFASGLRVLEPGRVVHLSAAFRY